MFLNYFRLTVVINPAVPAAGLGRVLDELPGLGLGESVTEAGEDLHHVAGVDVAVLVLVKYPKYSIERLDR